MSLESKSTATLEQILPPAVETKRGYGLHLGSTKRNDRFCYCNGTVVVVRGVADPTKVIAFTEHKAQATVAKFNPTGLKVASGDAEGNVYIWEVEPVKLIKKFEINQAIYDISWSEDSKRIIASGAGQNSKSRVFMTDSGNSVGEVSNHSAPVLSCDFRKTRPYRIVTCGEDNAVNFYSGPPFKFTSSFKKHQRFANTVRFSPNGEEFVSVAADSMIVVFDGKTGEVKKEIKVDKKDGGHGGAIYSFDWSPDSKQIITASADKTCKVWDVAEAKVVKTFNFAERPSLTDMQVSVLWHQETQLSVSLSGQINYLDATTEAPSQTLVGQLSGIKDLAIDRKSKKIYLGEVSGKVTEWDLETKNARWLEGKGHGKAVTSVALANGKLLTAGFDDRIRFNDLTSFDFNDDSVALGGQPVAIAVGKADESKVAVILIQGKLAYFNGNDVKTIDLGYVPQSVAFSNDDSKLYIGGKNKKISVYNTASLSATPASQWTSSHYVTHLQVLSDDRVVSVDWNRQINFWTHGQETALNADKWEYHQANIQTSALSPSGNLLATAGADQLVYIWSDLAEYRAKRMKFEAHAIGVCQMEFLDETTLITVGDDRLVKIWTLPEL